METRRVHLVVYVSLATIAVLAAGAALGLPAWLNMTRNRERESLIGVPTRFDSGPSSLLVPVWSA